MCWLLELDPKGNVKWEQSREGIEENGEKVNDAPVLDKDMSHLDMLGLLVGGNSR